MTHSYLHRGGDLPLLGVTIAEHFAAVAARCADREAVVVCHQNRRLTYGELAQAADRLARGLLGAGFGKGDRIGIWSTDNVEWLKLQLATARIGAVLVNINPAYRPRELGYALERAEVQGLFTIPAFRANDYVAMLCELIPELADADAPITACKAFPKLRRVVLYDPVDAQQTARARPGLQLWQEVLAAGEAVTQERLDAATAELDPDDPINIQYTSGTTGFPKAVVLTHHNILNNAWFAAQSLHFTETDRLCVPVPFYHCFGMVLANLLCLSVGACLVVPEEHFEPLRTLEAIQSEHCTAVHGVPTMFIAMLEEPRFGEFNLTSLRTGIMAGAPCPAPLMKRVIEEMHCPEILIGYGQTEASPLTHLTHRSDSLAHRTETVGRNLPHQEVKVVHPQSGLIVARGAAGEVCFRGYHVMRGYYNDTGATAHAIDKAGWLHSGDTGSMDADGYLHISGRLKELIIRGGENVYPTEIEAVLYTHPKVAEVAVFGVPDEYYGEEVMAWVQPHPDQTVSEAELREYCGAQLAQFKVPKYIWLVEEFPMTVTGKLRKYKMRELAAQRLAEGDDGT